MWHGCLLPGGECLAFSIYRYQTSLRTVLGSSGMGRKGLHYATRSRSTPFNRMTFITFADLHGVTRCFVRSNCSPCLRSTPPPGGCTRALHIQLNLEVVFARLTVESNRTVSVLCFVLTVLRFCMHPRWNGVGCTQPHIRNVPVQKCVRSKANVLWARENVDCSVGAKKPFPN